MEKGHRTLTQSLNWSIKYCVGRMNSLLPQWLYSLCRSILVWGFLSEQCPEPSTRNFKFRKAEGPHVSYSRSKLYWIWKHRDLKPFCDELPSFDCFHTCYDFICKVTNLNLLILNTVSKDVSTMTPPIWHWFSDIQIRGLHVLMLIQCYS